MIELIMLLCETFSSCVSPAQGNEGQIANMPSSPRVGFWKENSFKGVCFEHLFLFFIQRLSLTDVTLCKQC